MGVPKFYRWISERYPCLSDVVKEHKIPPFDNLYLDMNGIIHVCSHPDDGPCLRLPDERVFGDICRYVEFLVRTVRPRRCLFLAVDGVAPRAKVNQQRARRFRTAKDMEIQMKKAQQKGESKAQDLFDSNAITPGTAFMGRLHDHLKNFVQKKMSSDKLWQQLAVYLSGHEVPGEGEHKIMEFIRAEKTRPGYDPHTRHCLYGLDADLIVLGLTTHEPNFSLLREEVRFGSKNARKRVTSPEEMTFHLLHLSLLRDYIGHEFESLETSLSFPYVLESVIDDWVLMGFLVGNDFIPHLPNLHINQEALPLLYRAYLRVLPTLDGYINEGGVLNLPRFEKYLQELSKFDRDYFSEIYVDLKWFASKTGQRVESKASPDEDSLVPSNSIENVSDDSGEEDLFEIEFRQYKEKYYTSKMGVAQVTSGFLHQQTRSYIEAIQWILSYYSEGVTSWSWFFPAHYAPFLSDLRGVATLNLNFNYGAPFRPFEQLLAVLPPASRELLPLCYQNLMTDPSSPILQFYPEEFLTDLNGKQQDWEAVVLIPFVNEIELLAAMSPYNHHLTDEEKRRNEHGHCLLYTFDSLATVAKPEEGDDPRIRVQGLSADIWRIPSSELLKGLSPGVDPDAFHRGFPSLRHIKYKVSLKKAGVTVFQQKSRADNMILEILPSDIEQPLEHLAQKVIRRVLLVNWPHLEEALVTAVTDGHIRFSYEGGSITRQSLPKDGIAALWKEAHEIAQIYETRKGVLVGEMKVLLQARLLMGQRFVFSSTGNATLEKQWRDKESVFLWQTTVQEKLPSEPEHVDTVPLQMVFPLKSSVFMLGSPYYGCQGDVLSTGAGRVSVLFNDPSEPEFHKVIQNQQALSVRYSPGYIVASRIGISPYMLSRITGTIYVVRGSKNGPKGDQRCNVGLNLKFSQRNEEVRGYTRREGSEWLYSAATEGLLSTYVQRFPDLFRYLSRWPNEYLFYEDDIWPSDEESGADYIQVITQWLRSLPISSIARTSCGQNILDPGVVAAISHVVDDAKVKQTNKKVKLNVKPHLLYKVDAPSNHAAPDPNAKFHLFDRVVNVRTGYPPPLGLRGTIIGICGAEHEAEIVYEVLFDSEFLGGQSIRCEGKQGYRVPPSAVVNLSHGNRMTSDSYQNRGELDNTHTMPHSFPGKSQRPIVGLNHSPHSPFVPLRDAKQENEFTSAWESTQSKDQKPAVYILKRQVPPGSNGNPVTPAAPRAVVSTEFNKLLASLNVTDVEKNKEAITSSITAKKGNEALEQAGYKTRTAQVPVPGVYERRTSAMDVPPRDVTKQVGEKTVNELAGQPSAPDAFAQRGREMLMQMLKIDSSAEKHAGMKPTQPHDVHNRRQPVPPPYCQANQGPYFPSNSPFPFPPVGVQPHGPQAPLPARYMMNPRQAMFAMPWYPNVPGNAGALPQYYRAPGPAVHPKHGSFHPARADQPCAMDGQQHYQRAWAGHPNAQMRPGLLHTGPNMPHSGQAQGPLLDTRNPESFVPLQVYRHQFGAKMDKSGSSVGAPAGQKKPTQQYCDVTRSGSLASGRTDVRAPQSQAAHLPKQTETFQGEQPGKVLQPPGQASQHLDSQQVQKSGRRKPRRKAKLAANFGKKNDA
uniref:5'-3' exoribonuclease 1-like isoform X2 n=1 Tax=Myxine glutinosa TaxID=7769 RepID=UPI00358E17BF